MTEDFLKNYFEGLASAHQLIMHTPTKKGFYRVQSRMDLDEFEEALRSMTGKICLLLELGSGNFGSWDTPADSVRVGLHVLIKTSEIRAEISAARDLAKAILKSTVTRINYDRLDEYSRLDHLPGPLMEAKVKFDNSGRYEDMEAGENWYGKSLYFDLRSDEDFIYNPNDWN